MKYIIIAAVLSVVGFGVKAQGISAFEKLLQLERTRHFPYCGKLNLSQSFPDPVGPSQSSVIRYRAIDAYFAEIVVYDGVGQIILSGRVEPGVGEFEIHSGQLKPGKYYYALIVNGRMVFKKKLIVLES